MPVRFRPPFHIWSPSIRFTVVCVAAIVSLGDFWRLPYLLSAYGGGAFALVYAAAVVLMGLPLFSAQILLARGRHTDIPGVVSIWTRHIPCARLWVAGAWIALFGVVLLLAAYAVIASWSLAWSMRALAGVLPSMSIDDGTARLAAFARDGERGMGWLLLFVLLLVATTAPGFRRGTVPVMRTLAVCIVVLLIIVGCVAIWLVPGADIPAPWLRFDFPALGVRGVLEALYQAFFSLSLGSCVILSLASHLSARAPAVRLSAVVIVASQAVVLAFALVIAVLVPDGAVHLSGGAQRIFEVFPNAVDPAWTLPLLFVLLTLLGMTTGIGLFEVVVQAAGRRFRLPRPRAAIYAGLVVAILGLLAQNAFGALASWQLWRRNIFDWFSMLDADILIPIAGLMLCVLVGDFLPRRRVLAAWQGDQQTATSVGFALWYTLLRYPARLALIAVVAYSLGALTLIEAIWGPI